MEKKIYSRPQIKTRNVDTESMLAASDPKSINVTPGDGTISSGRVDSKQNTFFVNNVDNNVDNNSHEAINWND